MDNTHDNKIKLRILGISYNPLKSGAFALLLAQEGGPYRIPVMIGALEAQSIAIKIEGVVTPRPVTHDLFCSLSHAFGLVLQEVYIYKFEDGIFYSELTFTDGERTALLEARTSDAIAIAIRTGAPIYTNYDVLFATGAVFSTNLDDDAEDSDYENDEEDAEPGVEEVEINLYNNESAFEGDVADDDYEDMPLDHLENLLQQFIDEERYELAARISEIIKRRKAE